MESFHHVKWSSTEVWFDDLKHCLGPIGATMRFIVQDPIPDAIEIGIDTFVQHGRFAYPCALGVERKDAAYFGCVVERIPEIFAPISTALSAYFKEADYNNFFSNEMRIKMCVEAAKAIEGYQLTFEEQELDKAEEEIRESGLMAD